MPPDPSTWGYDAKTGSWRHPDATLRKPIRCFRNATQVRPYFHRYTEDLLDLCDILGQECAYLA